MAAWRGYPGAASEDADDAGEVRHGATGDAVADVRGNVYRHADTPVLLFGGGRGILDWTALD